MWAPKTKLLEVDVTLHSLLKWAALNRGKSMKFCTGEAISGWLTQALQSSITLRLVRMKPGFIRPQGQPENLGAETNTHFADAAPFLIVNEASLESLNRELQVREHSPVPMDRFRANIVVRGLAPFAKHSLKELESKNYSLKICHPCERCVVTTIDQATVEKDTV